MYLYVILYYILYSITYVLVFRGDIEVNYNVKEWHFQVFEKALMMTLREGLGDLFVKAPANVFRPHFKTYKMMLGWICYYIFYHTIYHIIL